MTWYDGQPRLLEVLSDTALWYTSGQDPLPMRWVLVRDPAGKLERFLHGLSTVSFRIMSAWFIARTTPILLGLYSLHQPAGLCAPPPGTEASLTRCSPTFCDDRIVPATDRTYLLCYAA